MENPVQKCVELIQVKNTANWSFSKELLQQGDEEIRIVHRRAVSHETCSYAIRNTINYTY